MNYIFKNEGEPDVVITKNTKVMKTGTMEVPLDVLEKGERIENPPPAVTRPIKAVKTSPDKSLVSVNGRVVPVSIHFNHFCIILCQIRFENICHKV